VSKAFIKSSIPMAGNRSDIPKGINQKKDGEFE
jgi:hypothetical protein